MKKEGTVLRWDAARGFGFIRSASTSADIFFHTKDFRGAAKPQEGMAVSFDEIQVGGKGPRAVMVQPATAMSLAAKTSAARPAGVHPSVQRPATARATSPTAPRGSAPPRRNPPAPPARAGLFVFLMLVWAVLLAWGNWTSHLPAMILPVAVLLNLVTFFIYWVDKHAAQTGQWRISENTLHLFGLLGGWPGAWCAQQTLRHKSSKASIPADVLGNCGVAFWPADGGCVQSARAGLATEYIAGSACHHWPKGLFCLNELPRNGTREMGTPTHLPISSSVHQPSLRLACVQLA